MSVIITELTKLYGSQRAVDSISFEAKPEEIVGFLGPNGAGKSTTMKMITGYIPPNAGSINVCGYDILKDSMKVRNLIGYLPEHNPLYLDMYVHEYLQFIASLHKIKGVEKKKKTQETIEKVGLQTEQKKKIGALSKGYRQRVGLASALIHNPSVLILDEPTTGLDPNQIVEIRNLIKNIGKEKTVIFSSHLMQEVEAVCDRVLIINKGKLVADNTVSQLQAIQKTEIIIFAEFSHIINTDLLKNIINIIEVIPEGNNIYKIISDGEADIRGYIFKLASENNWTLIGLKQQENSLETIFRELTK